MKYLQYEIRINQKIHTQVTMTMSSYYEIYESDFNISIDNYQMRIEQKFT